MITGRRALSMGSESGWVFPRSPSVRHDRLVTDSWAERGIRDPNRLRAAWPAIIAALPIGSRVTGEVVARQPFGVFIRIDGVPDALGLAEITSLPDDAVLPVVGRRIAGEVIWHVEHNHQNQAATSRGRERQCCGSGLPGIC